MTDIQLSLNIQASDREKLRASISPFSSHFSTSIRRLKNSRQKLAIFFLYQSKKYKWINESINTSLTIAFVEVH